MIIAVDGPAGSGKSTVARALATALSLRHIDTGAMYRALALKALRRGLDLEDEGAVVGLLPDTSIELASDRVLLDGEEVTGEIRDRKVTSAASVIAEHPGVRRWMVTNQRRIVKEEPSGAVVEGRDIGTVVLPNADLKVFLTAAHEERVRRRAVETGTTEQEIVEDLISRDDRDTRRSLSPLRAAEDAITLDSTSLSVQQVLQQVLQIIGERSR
ncbi:MAG TPA: (d)CMP kinase [Actinomycetota bacterium]|nr:(d)CMP kinase [Actinomycetota bacterium]